MPNIIEITDLSAPELDIYARLTQAQLRSRLEPEKGIFIAESPKVIARALDAGYTPLSLLMERRQITGPAAEILTRCGDAPVYTADRELLAALHQQGHRLIACVQRPVDDLRAFGDEDAFLRFEAIAQLVLGQPGIRVQLRRVEIRDLDDIGHTESPSFS